MASHSGGIRRRLGETSLQFQLFQFQLFFCGVVRGGYRGRIMLRPYMGVLLLEY